MFIGVLLEIGDLLVLESDERGSFDFGNESRVTRVVYHLLKRVDRAQRQPLLKTAIDQGRAIGVQRYLIASLSDELEKAAKSVEETLMDASALDELKASWLIGLKTKFNETQLLAHVQLASVLSAWCAWGDIKETRTSLCVISTLTLLSNLPHLPCQV